MTPLLTNCYMYQDAFKHLIFLTSISKLSVKNICFLLFFRNITIIHQDCSPTFEGDINHHYSLLGGNYSNVLHNIQEEEPDYIFISSHFYDHLDVYHLLKEKNYEIVIFIRSFF